MGNPADIVVLSLEGRLPSSAPALQDLVSIANYVGAGVGGDRYAALTVEIVTDPAGIGHVGRAADGTPTALVVPGCLTDGGEVEPQIPRHRTAVAAIAAAHRRGALVAASCSAVFLAAEGGLADGRRVTTTWWAQDAFERRYRQAVLVRDAMLVEDDRLVTAAGPFSVLELGLAVMGRLRSPALASQVARYALVDRAFTPQSVFRDPALLRAGTPLLFRARAAVLAALPEVPSVAALAASLGLAERTFQRRLLAEAGQAPKPFIDGVRIAKARELLETSSRAVKEVAQAVGYAEETAFRRRFGELVGMSPRQYAKRFGDPR
ncbi:helix-turn-helix domain-containing protein [Sphingomonas lenta]|uniref:AraC family transcriptional regulator n=1 Tax=Sphingomonas lenta TaxID=1141887 RepID=A0A2A2SCG7_9SPHN|nr:helix-turn-helix domain-containing protein [Sphingomonas lenta]PAX06957.1 AraC family transcriptional regulator [Sphingomonas lenta]